MGPPFIALHYLWFYLQGNEAINPHKYGPKIEEQPIVTVSHTCNASNFTQEKKRFQRFPNELIYCAFADI